MVAQTAPDVLIADSGPRAVGDTTAPRLLSCWLWNGLLPGFLIADTLAKSNAEHWNRLTSAEIVAIPHESEAA